MNLSDPDQIRQDFYQSFGFMTSNIPEIFRNKLHLAKANHKPKLHNFVRQREMNSLLDDLDCEDPSFLLNTLYFTDAISEDEPSPYLDAMKRKKWLYEAYNDYYCHRIGNTISGPKTYLLKLIEFNKVVLLEKLNIVRDDWWCTSSDPSNEESDLIEIQICMTRLLR